MPVQAVLTRKGTLLIAPAALLLPLLASARGRVDLLGRGGWVVEGPSFNWRWGWWVHRRSAASQLIPDDPLVPPKAQCAVVDGLTTIIVHVAVWDARDEMASFVPADKFAAAARRLVFSSTKKKGPANYKKPCRYASNCSLHKIAWSH